MGPRLDQIVIDCTDPATLVRFWAELLGGKAVHRALGWAHVEPPGFPRISFQPVPEVKQVKNRLHVDLRVDSIEDAVARAVALGAVTVGVTHTDETGSFQVMRDPGGNEFCFVS